MTCAHVLGLIDAAPFANYPAGHLDAAWDHARACATCGPALNAAAALTAGLARLPQPEPPAHLAAAVLARIARLDPPERSRAATAVHTNAPAVPPLAGHSRGSRRRCGSEPRRPVTRTRGWAGARPDIATHRSGERLAAPDLERTHRGQFLAVSLVVYLIALFVPLRVAEPRRQ